MARKLGFKFIRATRTALNTAAGASGLLEGEPYLISDEGKLAIGLTDSTYAVMALATQIYWQRNTTKLSPATAGDKLEISSTSASGSRAIKGTAAGQVSVGVEGIATGTASMGGKFTGDGFGINVASAGYGAVIVTTGEVEILSLTKNTAATDLQQLSVKTTHNTSETPADGFGVYDDIELETSTTASVTAAREVVKWATAAHATATSIREWWLKGAGAAIARVMAITGIGQMTLDKYGSGTFTGTVAKWLGVTSAGAVIELTAPDESKWAKVSTTLSPKTANDVVSVTGSGTPAIYGESSAALGTGISGKNASGYGVYGEGLVGVYGKGGIGGEHTNGNALNVVNTDTSVVTAKFRKSSAVTDSVGIITELRHNTSDTAAAGFGVSQIVIMDDAAGSDVEAFSTVVKWTAATAGAVSSQYELNHVRAGTPERCFAILPTGQLMLDLYTGSMTGTYTRLLGTTSAGAVVQQTLASLNVVEYSQTVDDSANIGTADIGKTVKVNKATAVTLTLQEAEMVAGQVIGVYTILAGQVTIAVETPSHMTLVGAVKSAGQYTRIAIICEDATANAEVYNIIGGVA